MRAATFLSSPLLFAAAILGCSSEDGQTPSGQPSEGTVGSGGANVGTGGAGPGSGGVGVGTGGTGGGVVGVGGGTSTGGVPGGGGQIVGSGGGVPGTGGGPAGTLGTPYPSGIIPATVFVEDAQAAYEAWKAIHLEDCGSGVFRVRWENAKLDATVSEGIGYGMLLTVMWDDQAAFDGLFNYYKLGRNSDTGLMHWLRYGCDAHSEQTYNQYPDGAAADADLDVAMALIMADCKWGGGSYASDASGVIANIRTHMFMTHNGLEVLQPGDSGWFNDLGNGCVNYSYFAPAYYREYARYDQANADFWNKAAGDTYTLLASASDSSTGLVRNWGSSDGGDATPDCHNAYIRSASYGDDAARTPWRIATDYLWNGASGADQWSDKMTAWVNTVGITNTVQWYLRDGNPDTEAPTYQDHTAINVGPWAVGAMTYDQASVDAFSAELVRIPSGSGDHDGEYFPRMLKALSLATLVGKFTACGGQ